MTPYEAGLEAGLRFKEPEARRGWDFRGDAEKLAAYGEFGHLEHLHAVWLAEHGMQTMPAFLRGFGEGANWYLRPEFD